MPHIDLNKYVASLLNRLNDGKILPENAMELAFLLLRQDPRLGDEPFNAIVHSIDAWKSARHVHA